MIPNFNDNELKPFAIIKHHMRKGNYEVTALLENDDIIAVAFVMFAKNKSARLLDYFVVSESYRSQGIGGKFLQSLQGNTPLIIETESLREKVPDSEYAERKRRDSFYKRNGVNKTKYTAQIWSCLYDIWCLGSSQSDEEVLSHYDELYKSMIPKKMYDKFCTIPYKDLP
ncbi:MAG: GNAT family N-acetyltransferase [Saccharofermentans sp.]|nr:GNAT family N-acetyltransferase [Saccharofermentans sp.]